MEVRKDFECSKLREAKDGAGKGHEGPLDKNGGLRGR